MFADRNRMDNDEEIIEYLVKWKGLSYCDSTWYNFIPVVGGAIFGCA